MVLKLFFNYGDSYVNSAENFFSLARSTELLCNVRNRLKESFEQDRIAQRDLHVGDNMPPSIGETQ